MADFRSPANSGVIERVLITGAGGNIGKALEDALEGEGLQVFPLRKKELDVTSSNSIRIIDDLRPDILFHTAAMTDTERCEKDPEGAYLVNSLATRNIAFRAGERGFLLVYFSTDYIFDGRKGEPYTEEDHPNPLSVYGKTKLMGERSVIALSPSHLIVRTQWVYGKGEDNFLWRFLDLFRSARVVKMVADQKGVPTSAPDLSRALLKVVKRGGRGVVNIVQAGEATWFDVAEHIKGALDLPVTLRRCPARDFEHTVKRPRNSMLSASRLEADFGITMRGWREALSDFMKDPETMERINSLKIPSLCDNRVEN